MGFWTSFLDGFLHPLDHPAQSAMIMSMLEQDEEEEAARKEQEENDTDLSGDDDE